MRMNRARRLQSARHWLATQTGCTTIQIAKSYRKRFGVDWPCAFRELSILGIQVDARWVVQLYAGLQGAQRASPERQGKLQSEAVRLGSESDDHFAYIAGYTPGGAPFGVTWEEWRQMKGKNRLAAEGECPF